MKFKQTKTLENAILHGVYFAQKSGGSPIDRAMLYLLEEGNCHASYILERFVKGWEVYQLRMRIEKELENEVPATSTVPDSKTIDNLLNTLCKISSDCTAATDDAMVNTGHFLLHILRSRKYVSSRILGKLDIPKDAVLEMVTDLPPNEDYYPELNALRNVRLFRIGPGQSDGTESISEQHTDREDTDDSAGEIMITRTKKSEELEKYGRDLTSEAVKGTIDPVIGREEETKRLIQILGRRKKNNPILIGEAGVGKSAIVEGLALRIASGDVPAALRGKRILSLDVASLVAGTKYRGQFEERMKTFIDMLRNEKDIILFIDEIHTIVGAGSTQGGLDTANILKPALARGELQCIGATTLDEYRETIEQDGALERRFQKIIVEPTSHETTLKILENLKDRYENHHNVRYSDESLKACVELTERYITDRHFPDKAIDVLDEAGSRLKLHNSREPESILKLEKEVRAASEEKRKASEAMDYAEATKARLKEIARADRLKQVRADWQLEQRRNRSVITAEDIREVVSTMTGIPLQSISNDEKSRLKGMYEHLSSRVIGQSAAIDKVTKAIRRSRAGLKDPDRPAGVFMFVGPTGVGKTLLVKELAQWMFGSRDALVRIDMSEYSEKHNVSRLIGSPPGYVGYNEGGQLTEIIRRQPYSVVLFDEIEKAHPDVLNIMLQIFDEGRLTDGSGRKVDFRNTIIIMTSNVGSRRAASRPPAIGYGNSESLRNIEEQNARSDYRSALEATFAPEFLNRIDDIVIFETLSRNDISRIVDMEFDRIAKRAAAMGYMLELTSEARNELTEMGYDPRYGARSLRRMLLEHIEEPLASMIVDEEITSGDSVSVELTHDKLRLLRRELAEHPRTA